jgi:hypothetical protein
LSRSTWNYAGQWIADGPRSEQTSVNLKNAMTSRVIRALLGVPLAICATLAAVPVSMIAALWRRLNPGGPPPLDVGRKIELTEEEWNSIEALYEPIDPILTAFATQHGLELERNYRGDPNRLLGWRDELDRKIWLDCASERGTYRVSIAAHDRSERHSMSSIEANDVGVGHLNRILERARDRLALVSLSDLWSLSRAKNEALRKASGCASLEDRLRDAARREGRDVPDHHVRIGDRVRLFGGYEDIEWLGGHQDVRGVVEDFIQVFDEARLAVVKLDEALPVGGAHRRWAVLQLRYVGATWQNVGIVSVELVESRPPALAGGYRPTGTCVESHASYELTH